MRNGILVWFSIAISMIFVEVLHARQVEQEVSIGRTSGGALTAVAEGVSVFRIPVSVFPEIPGWASGEVGFHSADHDHAEEDFFALPGSVHIRFSLVSTTNGVRVLNDTGTDWMQPGEMFTLGTPFFDIHPVVNIPSAAPNTTYEVRVVFHDTTMLYADSEVVTLPFVPTRACGGDWNYSGGVDSQDFFEFLTAFFALEADVNGDGTTSSPDFFEFLADFFAGC